MYMKMYITVALRGKRKKERKNGGADSPKTWTRTGTGGVRFSQALQNETKHRQDLTSRLQELGIVLDG
jgi:hypothetical protein